jgi:hypothetical protein
MTTFSEGVRKATTFLLALFLWLHALFFLNIQSTLFSKCTRALRLAPSEVVLFALLVIFSFLAASGFWKTLSSLAYIYFFPFVWLGRVLRWSFLMLRAMDRWFRAQAATPQLGAPVVVKQDSSPIATALTASPSSPVGAKKTAAELLRFLLRPFRRFMVLWCILLLFTTHVAVVWLCLIVVLVQLARQIFIILKILLFSPWVGESLRKIGSALLTPISNALGALTAVTRDATPTDELRNLFNQLNLWRQILEFLRDPYRLSRWAWVLGIVFFASIYTYIAVLFSFAYYGIARVSSVSYSWPDALVTSVFISFFFRDLPKLLAIKLLSGVHVLLVLGVGIGTIVNFLGRKLEAIRKAATEMSDRFADQSIHEKYTILEEKFSTTTTSAPSAEDAAK